MKNFGERWLLLKGLKILAKIKSNHSGILSMDVVFTLVILCFFVIVIDL